MSFQIASRTAADPRSQPPADARASSEVGFDSELEELHPLNFPHDRQLEALYFHLERAEPVARDTSVASFVLHRGDVLSADSFLNSFYERYWAEYTNVDSVALELIVRGRLTVEINRVSAAIGVTLAATSTVGREGAQTVVRIDVPPPHIQGPAFYGRLFPVFQPVSQQAEIVAARWSTTSKPLNEPRIGLVMCTFNKPGEVVRNLGSIAKAFERVPEIAKLNIIDQGTKRVVAHEDYRGAAAHAELCGRFSVVEQENLGGAGGFTRGMLETFSDPTMTHVLVMDDDIVVDPSAFARLAAFLKHAATDAVVGGAMLDLYFRHMLHADAERANFDTLLYEPVISHGVDLRARGAADRYNEPVAGTYNGWWFCCIPRSAILQHGLPLPVFVRCDDSEFGTRLTTAGYPLVTFPGVFVWHEPFYAKFSAWMVYYEIRNFLIMAHLRKGGGNHRRAIALLRRYYGYLASGLFDHALAVARAVEDFSKGPDFVFSDTLAKHLKVTKELSALAPTMRRSTSAGVQHDVQPLLSRRIWATLQRLSSLRWVLFAQQRALKRQASPELASLQHFSWVYAHKRPALDIHNPYTCEAIELRSNPPLARQLTWRMLRASWSWWRARRSLARQYRAAFHDATTLEAWCCYLGLDVSQYSSVRRP